MKPILTTLLFFSPCLFIHGQNTRDSFHNDKWSFHFQATLIPQYHFPFGASYSGRNSLLTSEGIQTSFTSTIYVGRRLWKNATLYFNPEVAGGSGLSKALGIAGFPNGETFRIGDPKLKLYLARLYLEQKFAIGEGKSYALADLNQVAGEEPIRYFSIRAGKFSLADFFDDNAYSHDPRTQFMNWSLMSNGAWDYPANTRGYTVGFVLEYHSPAFSVRSSLAQVPTYANGPTLDNSVSRAFGWTLESEKTYYHEAKKGIVHLLFFYNLAPMGNYREAIRFSPSQPDIKNVRAYSKSKTGLTLSWEQQTGEHSGAFLRVGWNDGINETWAFTEIDHSLSGGWTTQAGKNFRNTGGIALAVNGLSDPHRDYIAAGGYGFILGDGQLNYSPEIILETYYSISISRLFLYVSPDYQFIVHPAYNKDRGPVHVVGLRMHIQI